MKDGGPAFPQNDAAVNRINNLDGMTLRDYFAAKAMQGCLIQCRRRHAESEGRMKRAILYYGYRIFRDRKHLSLAVLLFAYLFVACHLLAAWVR